MKRQGSRASRPPKVRKIYEIVQIVVTIIKLLGKFAKITKKQEKRRERGRIPHSLTVTRKPPQRARASGGRNYTAKSMKRAQSAGKAPESVQTREGEPGGAERRRAADAVPAFSSLSFSRPLRKTGKNRARAYIIARFPFRGEKENVREGKTVFSFLFLFFFCFFSFFLFFPFLSSGGRGKGKSGELLLFVFILDFNR